MKNKALAYIKIPDWVRCLSLGQYVFRLSSAPQYKGNELSHLHWRTVSCGEIVRIVYDGRWFAVAKHHSGDEFHLFKMEKDCGWFTDVGKADVERNKRNERDGKTKV